MPQQDICTVCNRPAVQTCPSCEELAYCSPGCHDSGHLIHDLACQSLQAAPPKSDPESRHVLGVLFPDAAAAPAVSLVWVPISGFTDPDSGISFHEPEVISFFGTDDHASLDSIHSERNRVRNRDTRSMLEIWHRKGDDAGDANACIRALANLDLPGLDGAPFHDWKGPVLVLFMTRSTGFMVDPGTYRDAGQQDVVDAVDFVLDHGNDIHEKRIQQTLETLGRVVEKTEGADAEIGGSEPSPPGVVKEIVMEME